MLFLYYKLYLNILNFKFNKIENILIKFFIFLFINISINDKCFCYLKL